MRLQTKHIVPLLSILLVITAGLMLLGLRSDGWFSSRETTPPSAVDRAGDQTAGRETAPDPSDGRLLLANPQNPLPDGYEPELTQLQNGHSVDSRCYPDLQKMLDDCRAAGLSPLVCSSYRTWEKQERLYGNLVDKFRARGYSQKDAKAQAGRQVAVPGTSEHQTGLAVDIVDLSHQVLDPSQEDTAVQKWLLENSWRYGFILRYPSDKSDVTGIIYEPWHYRYVGKEAAEAITSQGLCLEEYLNP